MGGGAWPFLVGGVICLLNCDNERDSSLLTRLPGFSGRELWRCGGREVRRASLADWDLYTVFGTRGALLHGGASYFLEGLAAFQPHETEQ